MAFPDADELLFTLFSPGGHVINMCAMRQKWTKPVPLFFLRLSFFAICLCSSLVLLVSCTYFLPPSPVKITSTDCRMAVMCPFHLMQLTHYGRLSCYPAIHCLPLTNDSLKRLKGELKKDVQYSFRYTVHCFNYIVYITLFEMLCVVHESILCSSAGWTRLCLTVSGHRNTWEEIWSLTIGNLGCVISSTAGRCDTGLHTQFSQVFQIHISMHAYVECLKFVLNSQRLL